MKRNKKEGGVKRILEVNGKGKGKKKPTVINGDSINLLRCFICLSFIANAKLCKESIEKRGEGLLNFSEPLNRIISNLSSSLFFDCSFVVMKMIVFA